MARSSRGIRIEGLTLDPGVGSQLTPVRSGGRLSGLDAVHLVSPIGPGTYTVVVQTRNQSEINTRIRGSRGKRDLRAHVERTVSRPFRLRTETLTGTAFAANHDGKQYLVTANHVVRSPVECP